MSTVRRAAIIGVNKYEDETIPELKGAENDAKELYERLTDMDSGGFEVAKSHFLTGKEATSDAIRQTLSDLLWKTDESDLSLFYFSGHGFQDEYGNGYIAPWNMRRTDPMVRGIRMSYLTDLLLRAKLKTTVLMILDCCYSGIATEGQRGAASAEAPRFGEWFSQLGHEDIGKGRIVLASSGKDEKSRERLKCEHTLGRGAPSEHPHGVFTYHLLEGLDGKAATGSNYEITLEGLRKYIDDQMADDPDHKPTFFGAGLTQADRITIARASQWNKINQNLQKATELLKKNDADYAFFAAQTLRDVISNYTTLPEAIALKQEIDTRLQRYGRRAGVWLLGTMKEPWIEYRDLLSELEDLVGNLSVDTIINQTAEMQSLLAALSGISSQPGRFSAEGKSAGEAKLAEEPQPLTESENRFLNRVKNYVSRQRPSRANAIDPGLGKPSGI
jgi:uncharacterized caspase-like protein